MKQLTIAALLCGIAACGGGTATPTGPTLINGPTAASGTDYAGTWRGTVKDNSGYSGAVTVTLAVSPGIPSLLTGDWTIAPTTPLYTGGQAMGFAFDNPRTLTLSLQTSQACSSPIVPGLPPFNVTLGSNLTGSGNHLSGFLSGGCAELTLRTIDLQRD